MRLTERQFDVLAKHHHAYLEGMAHRLTGNRQDAEDLVAETLADLWCDFDPERGASFTTFAHKVMHNTWANTLKGRGRQKRKAPGALVSLDDLANKGEHGVSLADQLAAPPDEYDIYEPEPKRRKTPKAGTPLTEREVEVLKLMAQGKATETIAGELFINERTVDFHLWRIYRRFGLPSHSGGYSNAVQAVIKGIQQGVVVIDMPKGDGP